MDKFWKEIREKNLDRVYLMYGEEEYLKQRYEKRLIEEFTDDLSGDMNISFFGTDVDLNSLMGAVETLPFFSEKRLVIVKDSKLFKSGKKNDSERLADYLSNVPESTCLVFIENEVDKRGKLFKGVSKEGRAIEFKTPSEKELIEWVKKELKALDAYIDNSTAAFFLRHVGAGMENAYSEIMKLGAFKRKGNITTEDIEEVCTKSLEAKIFDLMEAIGERKPKKALSIYRGMITAKEAPVMILTMVTRQFRLLLQCKLMDKDGMGAGQIAKILEQRDFVIKRCISQSRNFTEEILKSAMQECLNADVSFKTGKIKDELAVELIIIKYSS